MSDVNQVEPAAVARSGGPLHAFGEFLLLAGTAALVSAWNLPWGDRAASNADIAGGLEYTTARSQPILIVLAIGFLIAWMAVARSTFLGYPLRRWVFKSDPSRRAPESVAGTIVSMLAAVGVAIWAVSLLEYQLAPRSGSLALLLSAALLGLGSAFYSAAASKLVLSHRGWAISLVAVLTVGLTVPLGNWWWSRGVIAATTSAAPTAQPAPTALTGETWERPLAEGETLHGDAGGRLIVSDIAIADSQCSVALLGLAPESGGEVWRYQSEIPCAEREDLNMAITANDRVVRWQLQGATLYFDPATGEQLFPQYERAGYEFLGDVGSDEVWVLPGQDRASVPEALAVVDSQSGAVKFERQVPLCANGRAFNGPGWANFRYLERAEFASTQVDFARTSKVLVIPVNCPSQDAAGTSDRGVWVIDIDDPNLDRTVWVDQFPALGSQVGSILEQPLIEGDTLIVRGRQTTESFEEHTLYGIDLNTGAIRWQRADLPWQDGLLLGDGRLLLPDGADRTLRSSLVLDVQSGTEASEQYSADALFSTFATLWPVIADGKVYPPIYDESGSGSLQIRDLATGEPLGSPLPIQRWTNPKNGDNFGVVGGTYYCRQQSADGTDQIVGIR